MRIIEIIVDIFMYLFEQAKRLVLFLLELIITLMRSLYEKFDDISIPEKIIFLNVVPAFITVALPSARFHIFEGYHYVNNPLGVHMIGVAFLMFASLYAPWRFIHPARVILNAYYLIWVFYILFFEGVAQARPSYEITFGFYMNFITPAIYIAASAMHWASESR